MLQSSVIYYNACMLKQNVSNDQVLKLFIEAYKKSYSYETLWGGSPDHVKVGRI